MLKLDPQNGRAVEGKAAAQAGAASLRRSFVSDRTTLSGKAAKVDGLGGFDTEGVTVAKVPDYSGRLEFEVSPARVMPGDRYTVRDFLVAAFEHAGLDWERHVRFDERYLRPTEVDALVGDAARADRLLGWSPTVRTPQLAQIMVEADIAQLECLGKPWIDTPALAGWG